MRLVLLAILFILLTFLLQAAVESPPAVGNDSAISMPSDSLESAGLTDADSEWDFVYPMSPERREMLRSYSRFRNIWRFAGFFIEVIILLAVLYTGLSGRLQRWAGAISRRRFFRYFFYFFFFELVLYLVSLPVRYYRQFTVEHDYGFSNQTLADWFAEGLKGLGVEFVFGFVGILILYWLINRFRKWWLYLAVVSVPLAVLLIVIVPVVVAPMFNKFEPLKDPYLAREMTALAERAGINDPDIYQVDASRQSKKLNAYFTGMFGTRRMVLYDNIIEALSVEELKYVMAHEIGHYRMNHIWKGLIVAVIFIFAAAFLADRILPGIIRRNGRRFRFERLGHIASLPLLLLFATVFGFVTQPIFNGISRYYEYNSDEYGYQLSEVTVEVAASTFDKLSVYNLSDPNPSPIIEFWFYDHPSLRKRVENIKKL